MKIWNENMELEKAAKTRLLLILVLWITCANLHGQTIAIKSNLLSDALISPNLGAEFALSPGWTLDVSAHYQPFAPDDSKRWKHWMLRSEVRHWLCSSFAGHFWGAHLLGGRFNVGDVRLPFNLLKGTRNNRYEGWTLGAGISYGYHWVLAPHWGVEASLGLGAAYVRYDRYRCGHCGEKLGRAGSKSYFGPTQAAVSLVYIIQ